MTTEAEGFVLTADVVVLGGGPAGAWAAIMAAERGASVVLADKGRVGTSGAMAAANTAVIDVAPGSVARRQVIERRLERGLGLAQAEWIERMVDEANTRLRQLAEWGYPFARNDRGEIYRGSLRGPDYMQLLRRRLHKAGVRVLDHSPAFKCDACVDACPDNVFDSVPGEVLVIARIEDYQTCFLCELYCPTDALYISPFKEDRELVDEASLIARGLLGSYRRALGWRGIKAAGTERDLSHRLPEPGGTPREPNNDAVHE